MSPQSVPELDLPWSSALGPVLPLPPVLLFPCVSDHSQCLPSGIWTVQSQQLLCRGLLV